MHDELYSELDIQTVTTHWGHDNRLAEGRLTAIEYPSDLYDFPYLTALKFAGSHTKFLGMPIYESGAVLIGHWRMAPNPLEDGFLRDDIGRHARTCGLKQPRHRIISGPIFAQCDPDRETIDRLKNEHVRYIVALLADGSDFQAFRLYFNQVSKVVPCAGLALCRSSETCRRGKVHAYFYNHVTGRDEMWPFSRRLAR